MMDSRLCFSNLAQNQYERKSYSMKKIKSFVIYSSMMMVIMDSVLDPCEMKLLMLNTKISEIILHPSKTKGEEGTKKGKSKGSMFV